MRPERLWSAAGYATTLDTEDGVPPEHLTFHLSPGTTAIAAVRLILAKTRCPAELIESSIQHGVQTVSIPFQLSADFLPDRLRRPDAELTRLTAGLPPAAPAFDAIIVEPDELEQDLAAAEAAPGDHPQQ